jgi:hypothetical protein
LGAWTIAGGIICLVLGILIFAASFYFYNIQTTNVEYCNSFLGGLQGYIDSETAQSCSNAGTFQAGAMGGMILGGALAIVGLILAIVGAVQQGGKKQKVISGQQQTQEYQNLRRLPIQYIADIVGK